MCGRNLKISKLSPYWTNIQTVTVYQQENNFVGRIVHLELDTIINLKITTPLLSFIINWV